MKKILLLCLLSAGHLFSAAQERPFEVRKGDLSKTIVSASMLNQPVFSLAVTPNVSDVTISSIAFELSPRVGFEKIVTRLSLVNQKGEVLASANLPKDIVLKDEVPMVVFRIQNLVLAKETRVYFSLLADVETFVKGVGALTLSLPAFGIVGTSSDGNGVFGPQFSLSQVIVVEQ